MYVRNALNLSPCFLLKRISTGRISSLPTVLKLRGLSDELCKKYGYSTLETYTGKGDSLSPREYRVADNGQSWKFKLMADINDSMKRSGNDI